MIHRPQPFESEDEESLVDRSVSFVREVSARLRSHASRKWQATTLGVDVGILRRRRRQWLLAMGSEVYDRFRRGQLAEFPDLTEYFDELRTIDTEIASKESSIAELEEDERFEREESERMAAAVSRSSSGRATGKRRAAAALAPAAARRRPAPASDGDDDEQERSDDEDDLPAGGA